MSTTTKNGLAETLVHDGKTPFFIDGEYMSFLEDAVLREIVGENIPETKNSFLVRVVGKFFDWSKVGDCASKTFSKFSHTKKVSISFEKCTFVGGLQFMKGCQFERVSFTDCQFTDPVWNRKPQPYEALHISNSNFEKLILRRCIIANQIMIHSTYCRSIEIENVSAPWINLAGIGYANFCELKVQNFSGGTICFPSENKFHTILCDKQSIQHLEKGAGKVTVYV